MLEKLHDKFEDERTDLEKEESNARHAYEMLIQVIAELSCLAMFLTIAEVHEMICDVVFATHGPWYALRSNCSILASFELPRVQEELPW